MENKKLSKEEQTSKNFRKLKSFCKNLPKERRELAIKLCKKIAFMDGSLDRMQEEILRDGEVVELQNGNGFTVAQAHPSLKNYNQMIKNFCAASKQLSELFPEDSEEADELLLFVGRNKK